MKSLVIKTCIILFFTSNLFAQNYAVKGKVIDKKDNQPLAFTNVIIKNTADSTQWKGAITDLDGLFTINNVSPGNYKISASYIGYKLYTDFLQIKNTDLDAFSIKMESNTIELKNVEIVTLQNRATQKGDTTEFNANAYKVNPDANADDLISKLPGITSENGTVKAGGEDVKKVLIDGQEFFGEDATIALKNIPAEIIDKIQVYDKLSDQSEFSGFDDGNREKTINIKTKPGKNNGQFGKLYAGYGTDDRYMAGGNINFFNGQQRISVIGLSNNLNQQNFSSQDLLGVSQSNTSQQRGGGNNRGNRSGNNASNNFLVGQQGGINNTNSIGLNYTDVWGKKWKVNGSYFFNNSNNKTQSAIVRNYFLTDTTSQTYNETNNSDENNYNHRLNLRMEYAIDSANTLLFTPKLSFQQNNSTRFLNSNTISSENSLINRTDNENISNQFGYNFSNSLLYRHKFIKRGRTFSLNIKTDFNNKEGTGILNSNSDFYQSANSATTLNQKNTTKSNGYTLSTDVVYTEPITKKSQLSFNYTPSYSGNLSDKKTTNYSTPVNDYTLIDSTLSNNFDNVIFSNRAGIGYRTNSSKYNLSAGIDYQNLHLSGDQLFPKQLYTNKTFDNVLPKASFQYNFSKSTNFRLQYNTATQTPSIKQLQNVLDNTNPLLLSAGNEGLKQQYTHTISARFSSVDSTKTKPFFAMLTFNYLTDYIGNSTFIAKNDTVIANDISLNKGSQISAPVNLDGYMNARLFLTYGLPVSLLKSNLNFNLGLSYNRTPGLINNKINLGNTYAINSGFILGSNISEKVDFKLSYSANYSIVQNSIQPERDNNFYTGVASAKLNFLVKEKWVLSSDLNQNHYLGLENGYNQNIWLWNAGVGYKFLKNNAAEIKLSVFDILNQNNSINRNVTETYVEDIRTTILQRYILFTFTYNFRNFKTTGT